jgi:ATP-dependent Clp protease ATP-binding subunit ClpC
LNGIDEIIVFRQLDETELRQITELLLDETRRRLRAQHVTVQFTSAAVDWIAQHGFQPEFGARPMRRTIQREVDNKLSRMLLDGQISGGEELTVDVRDGHLTFDTTPQYAGV